VDYRLRTADLDDHFFEVDHFLERCLKYKRYMKAVMAPYKVVYKDMQKKAKQLNITSFLTKSSVSPYDVHSMSFDHPDNFQPGTQTSSQ
jgi:hypothetical protein